MSVPARLQSLIDEAASTRRERQAIADLVASLLALGCADIDDKLTEFKGGTRSASLIAELRFARAFALRFPGRLSFQINAEADIRWVCPAGDVTIEVGHLSSVDPWSAIAHPFPEDLTDYATSRVDWQVASSRLHDVLAARPFVVQPWLGKELKEPFWKSDGRTAQENRCAAVARWLADQLARLPDGTQTELIYTASDPDYARFEISPSGEPRGHICGEGPTEAYLLRERADDGSFDMTQWLARTVNKKAALARTYPERRGAFHLIALVVDEAYAHQGHVLLSALLGGLVSEQGMGGASRTYRHVPPATSELFVRARALGNDALLSEMAFDESKIAPLTAEFFTEPARDHCDGVLALYYTQALQFVPNPFRANRALLGVLPPALVPQTL